VEASHACIKKTTPEEAVDGPGRSEFVNNVRLLFDLISDLVENIDFVLDDNLFAMHQLIKVAIFTSAHLGSNRYYQSFGNIL